MSCRHCREVCAWNIDRRAHSCVVAEFVEALVAEAARQAEARLAGRVSVGKRQRVDPADVLAALGKMGCGAYEAPVRGALVEFSAQKVQTSSGVAALTDYRCQAEASTARSVRRRKFTAAEEAQVEAAQAEMFAAARKDYVQSARKQRK